MTSRARLRAAAARILERALDAAEPGRLVRSELRVRGRHLEVAGVRHPLDRGRIAVVAVGKAAVAMAQAAEERLGSRLAAGLVVTTEDGLARAPAACGPPATRCPTRAGSRPRPRWRRSPASLGRDDLLLVLLSGGASALLPAPAEGVTLADKALTTSLLLRSGASIHELNAVRKHLSRLKGGGLASAAWPGAGGGARAVRRRGRRPLDDRVGPHRARPDHVRRTPSAVLERRGVISATCRRPSATGSRAAPAASSPRPPSRERRRFRRVATRIVGSGRISVLAAAREARRIGLRPVVLTTRLEGEAREAARVLVAILREAAERATASRRPVCLLAGGETTVTVRGQGQGGRNQELAVAAAQALEGFPGPAVVASLATDGVDGASDGAGGIVDDTTTARAERLGLAPAAVFLASNDTRNYLGPLGDLILTGPTGTNVADIVALLATPAARKGYNARSLPGGHFEPGSRRRP